MTVLEQDKPAGGSWMAASDLIDHGPQTQGGLVLALLLVLTFTSSSAEAALINARSPLHVDVAAAVVSSSDGDTIVVPAGTADWTRTLHINKAITLQGAGMGRTILLDSIPSTASGVDAAVIHLNTVVGKTYRITGLEIRGGTRLIKLYDGSIQVTGNSDAVRIDHCRIYRVRNRGINIWDAVCGVVDHCVFDTDGAPAATVWHNTWNGNSWGDGSYATPVDWGTTKAMYFEDNYFQDTMQTALMDSYAGARIVFRYNNVTNARYDSHGTESSGRYRGTRSVEIYNNSFIGNFGTAIYLRSGSGVIFSNQVVGYGGLCTIANYRNIDPYAPWGGVDGINLWDSNAPTPSVAGTHTGSNGSLALVDATANWKANQWRGYVCRNGISKKFGMIVSNSATRIHVLPAGYAANQLIFSSGDLYQVYQVYAALDMPGMGQSDLLSGFSPTPAGWPRQRIDPLYQWANTFNGVLDSGRIDSVHSMREGTHFFNGTRKPDYSPLRYPHPLVTGSSSMQMPTGLNVIEVRED